MDGDSDSVMSSKLRDEIANLKNKVHDYEQLISEIKDDLSIVSEVTNETQNRLGSAQEELLAVSDDLAQLYHHVCTVNGETPSRVVLDHAKGSRLEDSKGKWCSFTSAGGQWTRDRKSVV